MTTPGKLKLSYYGDDFTGSTDALDFLSRAGIKTVLFIEPPTPEQLEKFPGLQGIGVAGMTRAMAPAEMEKELRHAFGALRALGAPHVHYKVCSTFDSSPAIGSIGKAIDVGAEIFLSRFIPLLVAAPALGRHCVFGNLFARMGTGNNSEIYRLDRHPSMSRHPTTPAHESDLRLHLGMQTNRRIELVDILEIDAGDLCKTRDKILTTDSEIILIDALYNSQLQWIGELIDSLATASQPLFTVGSSGVEMALGAHWQSEGVIQNPGKWPCPGDSGPMLVISGSCSPVTACQIAWARRHGFADVAIDTRSMAIHGAEIVMDKYVSEALDFLREGRDVILHTSSDSDDSRIESTRKILLAQGCNENEIKTATARLYGSALGQMARKIVAQATVKRLVVAGGDTSSYAARAMGIKAVEMIAPLAPGAPLCKIFAPGSPTDGLEVNFKGGQVGNEDYFGVVRKGSFI